MKFYYLLFVVFLCSFSTYAVEDKLYMVQQDREIFDRYINYISADDYTSQEVIMATSMFFLNTPYVAATLEKEPEGLVVNLRELDCTTFVETVLSLSKTVVDGKPSFESFCENLKQFRYRNSIIDGYTSRLHYTTDWIFENTQKGLVKDVTKEIGGDPLSIDLFFMSRNADKYKLLKDNPALIADMAAVEKSVNDRSHYFISKDRIDACGEGIKDGDMICFVTSIAGLDVSHVGIARWESGRLTFVHASSTQKKVVVQSGTLQEYAKSVSKNSGILVVRPQF
ncbi:N-acetylmuramoyl-L-alanine amidase-like domain-containing protein [Massilibacteroides vaginae]|uniref:N-acetylmuramoyl-L-alanine amidase-like domain-containing protein n=1 Tax=Massilibacteroides vaginae TaxID=1673718 RepID=UPI000A1CDBE0|nr:N-acetylmuramoyl-L-alanine amidase-like domain-containing protein [Massilibacteroides vaginae]